MKRCRLPLAAIAGRVRSHRSTVNRANSSFGSISVVTRVASGQATGQDSRAFGGGWYVISPAGKKIENEADESTGGGYR